MQTIEFFLVSLPGLEDLLAHEVQEWFPNLQPELGYGGVTVRTDLGQGLALNLCLKIPTRILMRVTKFRARDFPKLYRKTSEFEWDKWLDLDCELEVFAATKRSRLKIKKRIEEACLDGWIAVQSTMGHRPDPKKPAKLYVRIVEDEVTLSLDTSGERLHKRGNRQMIGEAPLRETIAAALIHLVTQTAKDETRPVEIIDPMMGSGTFLLEATTHDRLIDARDFGFESFATHTKIVPKLESQRFRVASLVGYEVDSKSLKAAKANLKTVAVPAPIQLIGEDLFSAKPLAAATGRCRWVFANPPYGERIKVMGSLREFYEKTFAAVETLAKPDRACFLLPAKAVQGKLRIPLGWKVLEKRRFLNGGIPVVAFVFGRTL